MSIDIRLYTVTLLVRSSPLLSSHYKANTIWGSLSTAKCTFFHVFCVLRHDVSHRIAPYSHTLTASLRAGLVDTTPTSCVTTLIVLQLSPSLAA